ncbi:MAG: cyclic pyranopterin monophosphate synthase MoaC [Candidatus Omnitrophica bacterium]|nr:cyclic pyranopterin monophosphate synthase MoaC [Candidatus Omnitrophota bacterium]
MIDITDKEETLREAMVGAKVFIKPAVIQLIKKGKMPKGDVLEAARLAGIMAAKKTAELIPMCHPIPIEYVGINFSVKKGSIDIIVTVKGRAKTGVEMEAFTAAAMASVTIYDMCKAFDRTIVISEIKLLEKSGGKSGL